ncbi:hypothetical protein PENTCL1PPCAC_16858 [Pristionchus entomophagus]|uniref:Cytochrome P450 n=1 Tax=Pristionchus entomophagus TaxID=358040 RepID=A0AAV5TK94_9BILA|nr:hypothetical protein PENTCL1PPCAC_16858 [Pristionchus entomophagus]
MIYLLLILCALIIFYGRSIAETLKSYRYRKRLSALIPGDEGIPIFGNLFELGRSSESSPRHFLERAKAARDEWNGEMIKIWVMHDTVFLPFTGPMLQSIIESNEEINKGVDYDIFEPWLGRGLLLASGDKWRARRKLLTPTFHFTMLLGYIDTMNRHTKVLMGILENQCGKEFDIYPYMKRCTLDVICDTAMGKDLDSLHHPEQPYVKSISKLMTLGMNASMLPHLWNSFGRWVTGWQKEHDINVQTAHDFTKGVISERMELLERGEVDANKKAFLDMLIAEKDRSNLSMDDIREEVEIFMFAGHDTTSAALGWTLWCLSHHQDMQERAFQEVREIFGDDVDRDCTKDDLTRMPYLDRCIKESLRLFPPVPFVIRHLEEELQTGPYLLPRGSSLVIAPYMVHRNERIYPRPEVYDPDRFLPENSTGRHPYDYIPFSAGPRNCIGQKFAQYQLKIIVSSLLRTFRFRSEREFNSVSLLSEVVLKAGEGINVVIEAR